MRVIIKLNINLNLIYNMFAINNIKLLIEKYLMDKVLLVNPPFYRLLGAHHEHNPLVIP